MKIFKLLVLLSCIIATVACKKTIDTNPKEVVFDRDGCKRCVMAVSDRLHSAQIVNGKTGEHFVFDDIGCAILYLEEKDCNW